MGFGGIGFDAAFPFGSHEHVAHLVLEQVWDYGGFAIYSGHHLVCFGSARSVAEAPGGGY